MNVGIITDLAIFVLILWIGTMSIFAIAVEEIRKTIKANTDAKIALIKLELNSQYGKSVNSGLIDVNSLYPAEEEK